MAPGGYSWWYVDALSDDGRHGLTIIAFVGSVFSPYYARARRRGGADPLDHCALNVALYGAGGKRWAMTERRRGDVERTHATLAIGASAMHWDGSALVVHVDEITFPLPSRLRGVVRVLPAAIGRRAFELDRAGRHRWWPIAPRARVEVAMSRPALAWSGHAYVDSNSGDEPLERAFAGWHWSRAHTPAGTLVCYDVVRRHGDPLALALAFDERATAHPCEPLPIAALPRTRWRIARAAHADAGREARVVETLEDTPFYARSLVDTTLHGERTTAVHESLSLDRFSTGWVRTLLPFRMPRR